MHQDGATWYSSNTTTALVEVVRLVGKVNYPSRSPNLTQLDYYQWDYFKKFYQTNNKILNNLKQTYNEFHSRNKRNTFEESYKKFVKTSGTL